MNATKECACIAKRICKLHIGIVKTAEAFSALVIRTNAYGANHSFV